METNDFFVKRISPPLRPYFVICAGVVLQFTYGLVYTFGNILPYLVSYLRKYVDPSQTSGSLMWLQSLMAGIPCAMLVGGYVERRIGARNGVILGSALYTGCLALSYFTIQKSFLLLLVTMGVVGSFGAGMSYNCVLIECQKWLPHRIGLVGGLITAGYGSGAFLISPLQTKYINPENFAVNEEGYFTQPELLQRVPGMFLMLATLFGLLQFVAVFFIAEPTTTDLEAEEEGEAGLYAPDQLVPSSPPPEVAALSHKEVILSDTFFVLFLTLLFNGIWVQTISGLFKAYGQTFIHNDFFLATVNSFAAATNCASRIFWGHVADKTSYQTSMVTACGLGAALMWTLGAVKLSGQPMLFLFWICAMYSSVGATFSLVPMATHRCFGAKNFGIAYGLIQVSLSFAGVTTALVSEFLLSLIGFQLLFTIVAGAMGISFLLSLLVIQRTTFGNSVC